jgi:crotonobetainyl-CoA:carnitine CoA-transferase CaiB-like acyl-CoA transferase
MPYAGAYLADLGAEVIKVDTHHAQFMESTRQATGPFPANDPGDLYFERGGTFQTLNRGKRSVTLDLRSEAARALVRELVGVCDVVLENFTPRVMARFELDYPNLKAHKPDLIMVSNTGYGHSGPWTNFGAMAASLEPTHGTGAFMGYLEADSEGRRVAGETPNKMGNSYTDFLATWTALGAVMACLLHRARTGRGTWVDLAMYQVGVSFVGEGLLDFAFNGRRTRRLGNRHQTMCPHGCYPCEGPDSWVTLAVRDDADWRALCRVLDQNGIHLADDPRFSDPLPRRRHQDELDDIIAGWTSTQGQYQMMDRLQAVGMPAGPVLNARELLSDAQFRERGFFESVQHPPETGLGRREYIGRGWKLSGNNLRIQGPAPRLGEANQYVLHEVLGRTGRNIQELRQEGVVGERPVGGGPPPAVPLKRQVELGWIVERDEDHQPR